MGVYTVNQTDGSLQRVAGGTLYADAPIGAIQSYGGVIAPAGWLICDGSAVSRTEYAELFAVIGINFGEGDGETTFGIPDLRECVPVGVGKNITKSIANHDRYDLGQFKDDALGTHDHPLKTVTTATYNTAGVPVGVAVNNTPTSATHGKQLGVNYIIKAKMVGVPADLEAQIDADYQKKDLAQAVEGETTVEDALGALSANKQPKTLDTPLIIAGTNQTTVEGALGKLNGAVIQPYSKTYSTSHDRYVKIGTLGISDGGETKRIVLDIEVFSDSTFFGYVRLNLESRYGTISINGETNIDIFNGVANSPAIVISKDTTNNVYVIYMDTPYSYLYLKVFTVVSSTSFNIGDFSANASIDGTEVFNSATDLTKIAYIKPDIYSTSETKTNKVWIDGKPIYRKVVNLGTLPSTDTDPYNVPHGITNISTVVSIEAFIVQSAITETIPNYLSDTKYIGRARFRNEYVSISTKGNWSEATGYAILEYTKTT